MDFMSILGAIGQMFGKQAGTSQTGGETTAIGAGGEVERQPGQGYIGPLATPGSSGGVSKSHTPSDKQIAALQALQQQAQQLVQNRMGQFQPGMQPGAPAPMIPLMPDMMTARRFA